MRNPGLALVIVAALMAGCSSTPPSVSPRRPSNVPYMVTPKPESRQPLPGPRTIQTDERRFVGSWVTNDMFKRENPSGTYESRMNFWDTGLGTMTETKLATQEKTTTNFSWQVDGSTVRFRWERRDRSSFAEKDSIGVQGSRLTLAWGGGSASFHRS